MNYTSIEKYINTFDPIPKGHRDTGLHNKGILLRTKFGLTGDALVSALSEVNQTKCSPPLPESDVQKIAQSVDRSNAPIGESTGTFERNGQHHRKTPKPERKTWCCTCTDSVPVDTLLSKGVCIYPNCRAKIPSGTSTIGKALEAFRTGGKSKELIEAVRCESDKDTRNELKQGIPAVVFGSEPQAERKNTACTPNGIICLDFDNIKVDALDSAKKTIADVSYVFAVGLSVGGGGLFALAAYENAPDLKTLLATIQNDFPYEIDKSRSDVCGLRYVTYDPDIIIKDKVCPAVLTERTEPAEYESAEDDIAESEPLRYVPFPVDCLPLTLAQSVRDTQRCINLKDPAMPAVSVLAVVASVIGSSCRIEIKRGHIESAALFTAIIADSGNAKSPSIESASKHLNALQAEKIKQRKREKYQWEQEYIEWKNAPKKERGGEPMPPQPAERFIISDVTIEAVAGILENNPLGVLLYRDELNGFFAGMDAYRKSATDLQSWIEIYEGRGFTVDRKTTGTVYIEKPSVSIVGGVQTGILKKTMKERADFIHSGFGSRFLFVMPEKEPIEWNLNSPDADIVANYENLIDRILIDRENALEKDETPGYENMGNAFATVKPIVFPLSKDARRILFDFQKRYARQSRYENAANANAMNKAGRIAAGYA